MNNLDKQYTALLQDILNNGVTKKDRTGTGTISVFGRQIRHKMSEGFPLLTTKKMYFKGIVTELLWFLRGDTNIKYLVENNCHIWDGDSWKRFSNVRKSMLMVKPPASEDKLREYIEWYEQITTQEEFINKIKTDDAFAKKWGDLGPIYGRQWRSWFHYTCNVFHAGGESHIDIHIDQIANLINTLKTDPDNRRMLVTAWNPAEVEEAVLPPCHYGFQFYTRELSLEERFQIADKINMEIRQDCYSYVFNNPIYTGGINQRPDDVERHQLLNELNIPKRALSLMFNMRSTDIPLGLPFNIASYGLLLEIIGRMVNMIPEELIANLGDAHIYKNQLDGVKEQLTRRPYTLPRLNISDDIDFTGSIDDFLSSCNLEHFKLTGYESHSSIKMPLSN